MINYSFPSLGQTIRFAIDVLGVLPRKRGDIKSLDETAKKRIQKKLQRLANEEGRLEENVSEIIAEVSEIIGSAVRCDEIRFAIYETLWDVYEVYNSTIKSEGTFLSEKETIEWFCINYAIPRLALSVPKHMLRTNMAGLGFIYPSDEDWYLPSVENGCISWPLAKVMRWIYELLDIELERFHYSNRAEDANHSEQEQNIENARKWVKGSHMPSWGGLHWTFSRAFEDLAVCETESHRRELPIAFRDNLYCILFIARFSTDLCKRIEKLYGVAFLEQCIERYQKERKWLESEVQMNRDMVEDVLESDQGLRSQQDAIWHQISDIYWRTLADRMFGCGVKIQEILEGGGGVKAVRAAEGRLIQQFGEYPVRACMSYLEDRYRNKIPDGFVEAFDRALTLKSSVLTDLDVDDYEADLKKQDLEEQLKWVGPWLRAVSRCKGEDYEGAMEFAEIAFNHAKYSAGGKQYDLINLYVELAAKNEDMRRFKKGVDWARFVGVKIRWLRDLEPTEENIRFAFDMLRTGNYVQF
ncbi:hypothetical protein [Teredinibacter turnerae]|uniref:hypothetical protein n=1 Tax=Teredinibacter turnerae TaxID=2426 RepID=UPI00037AC7D4|nr:hypothetical protein [Teredinibacter turnerae]